MNKKVTLSAMAKYLRISTNGMRYALTNGDYKDMPFRWGRLQTGQRVRLFDIGEVMEYIEKKFN